MVLYLQLYYLVAFNPIHQKLCSYCERIYNLNGSQIIRTPFAVDFFYLCSMQIYSNCTWTNIDKLKSKCRKFLKSWVRLPWCTTPGVLHIQPFTDIPTIHSLYLQSHAAAHAPSHIKANDNFNTALDSKVEHEEVWQRKFSMVIYCENKLTKCHWHNRSHCSNLPKVKRNNN